MIDAGESERGVENDATSWRLLYQLQQQRREHPWRLADEEDDSDDKQGARQSPVVRLSFVRRQIVLRRRSRRRDLVAVDVERQDEVKNTQNIVRTWK